MNGHIAVHNDDFEITVTPITLPLPAIATPNNGAATPASPGLFGVDDCEVIDDSKCTIQGDPVLVDKITDTGVLPTEGAKDDFNCAPTSVSPFTFTVFGKYTILAGSAKTTCSTKKTMIEGDTTTVNCTCAGTDSTAPTPIPFTGSCIIKISKAGQIKAEVQ